MNDKKSAVDNIKFALSRAPIEIHANIVYEMCRVNISRIDSYCSQLANEDELIQAPDKRLEVIESIYSNLGEIRNILWAAVEVSRSGNFKKNSNPEG
jgi:hypothetical protein